jgi:hypothetical protein
MRALNKILDGEHENRLLKTRRPRPNENRFVAQREQKGIVRAEFVVENPFSAAR